MSLWPDPAGNGCSAAAPAPDVIRHRALWSADFPLTFQERQRPSGQPGEFHHTTKLQAIRCKNEHRAVHWRRLMLVLGCQVDAL